MAPPQACQLNLLGVEQAFSIDLHRCSLSDHNTARILFEDAQLNAQELCVWSSCVQTPMLVLAWSHPEDFQAHQSRTQALLGSALNLLLCPSSPSHEGDKESRRLNTNVWRAHLAQAPTIPFEVVYGRGCQLQERIRYAWSAKLNAWGIPIKESLARSVAPGPMDSFCDKCSDPYCERRLFKALGS